MASRCRSKVFSLLLPNLHLRITNFGVLSSIQYILPLTDLRSSICYVLRCLNVLAWFSESGSTGKADGVAKHNGLC